jgi:hypothetical protein
MPCVPVQAASAIVAANELMLQQLQWLQVRWQMHITDPMADAHGNCRCDGRCTWQMHMADAHGNCRCTWQSQMHMADVMAFAVIPFLALLSRFS